ncbi:Mrp/NBP35 family ATP-binding protein [Boudabousia marimammalium]|uniref:Iron-sulfur cluster carrier protein n=1 Tax=Boudabousia marimammalium TaxID=156892 RepID=A0A1Q5PM21_9ACTO|nr:Mrp/NBP35 family ATP-binding protein [Boudabousia marimammalium]OKL48111.1 sodium:proton antiporter [Boudabousia marimammalium]
MSDFREAIDEALNRVIDPEIKRPITELGMVRSVEVSDDGQVTVGVDLTTAGCPLKDTITKDVKQLVSEVEGVSAVLVNLGVMSEKQKKELREKLTGHTERDIPFTKPDSLTRVFAITSGKGGVGKSSVTANLAAAMAKQGLKVGVVDADIYGFSIPRMLGVDDPAQQIDSMIIPPVAHDVKVMSIGMFVPDGTPVVWRGPMLHRALRQFLADVYWGDLDALLLDLPPGTGDVAISIAQLLPNAEIVVVTTPQVAAAEVAERAGSIATQTKQKVVGVIENMSYLQQEDGSKLELFGSGGGQQVSDRLSEMLEYKVPLLAQIPIDMSLREGSDGGNPVVLQGGEAAMQLEAVAAALTKRARGLQGRNLGVSPL